MTEQSSQMTPVQLLEAQLRYLEGIHKYLDEMYKYFDPNMKYLEAIYKNQPSERPVRIEDVNMPFMALVGFLVKVALAAIPAGLILGLFYFFVTALFGGLLAVIF